MMNWAKLPRKRILLSIEILAIIIWGLYITWPYLNMDPMVIPVGREFPSAIQSHHLWTRLRECGVCAMWNGSMQGGAPALVDSYGSMLHPFVAIPALITNIPNGAKISLVIAFIFAGLAQWWLAFILELSWPARLWTALLVMVAGHLATRMELGLFSIILSTASYSFVLACIIYMVKKCTPRSTVLLGISLALFLLSGQGYLQIGFFFTFPAILLLLPWKRKSRVISITKNFIVALGIAFLLASPFLVPSIHFLPQFGKDLDINFTRAQPFEYIPLNLIIRDYDFFHSESLSKLPEPSLNVIYIGWLPLLLAVYALFQNRSSLERRVINFLFIYSVLIFWFASAQPLSFLVQRIPFRFVNTALAGFRHPTLIAGMAVPSILGLTAIGLDRILEFEFPKFQISLLSTNSRTSALRFDLRWLIAIPLIWALGATTKFTQPWIRTIFQDSIIFKINAALQTSDLQWVNPPFGQHAFIEHAVGIGLKLHAGYKPWVWIEHPLPEPFLEASLSGAPQGMSVFQEVDGATIYIAPPGREYARIEYDKRTEPTICSAQGGGGHIDVQCTAQAEGNLVVKENSWSGWRAYVDGMRTPLLENQWLSVKLQPGEHTLTFRYRPWDVPLGILLSLIGIGWCIYLWLTDKEIHAPDGNQTELTSY